MTRIFISYRREDSAGYAGRLADALERRFGAGNVFRDVDDIAPGEDFVHSLHAALAECDVLIPVIGPHWLSAVDRDQRRRIDDPHDYVRQEIVTALQGELRIIPALVDGAVMPRTDQLPEPLAALTRRQALMLADTNWNHDIARLCQAVGGQPDKPPSSGSGAASHARAARRLALAAAGVAAIGALGVATWLFVRPPDLSGQWRLADGSQWLVRQSGHAIQIEEVHYESREVWRKGTGRVAGDKLEVELSYVFQPDIKLVGALQRSRDGRSLSGVLIETPGGRRQGFDLQR